MHADPIAPFAVDVVIAVRDGARYLGACLDSVRAQTRPARAVIVVDDGSTDATPDILAHYQRRWPLLHVVRTGQEGLPHARNIGIANCRAPFVAFLDCEDLWTEDKLTQQMELFARCDPRVGFVYCGAYSIDADAQPIPQQQILPRERDEVFRALLLEGNFVPGSASTVIARRSLLERLGGFDESLTFGEDWDLWLRLAEVSDLNFVPNALVAIRVHADGMAARAGESRVKLRLFQDLDVLDRWYIKGKLPGEVREQFRSEAVNIALDEVRRRPLAGWRAAWRLQRELRRGRNRLSKELFTGPRDFFRPFPFRIARASLRQFALPRGRRELSRMDPIYKMQLVDWLASPAGPQPSPFMRKLKPRTSVRLAFALRHTLAGRPSGPRRFECLYLPATPFIKVVALRHHARVFGTRVFVETGTSRGDTTVAVADLFERCYTIELSAEFCACARKRFTPFPHVTCIEGESSAELPKVLQNIDEPVLFWLDAHATGSHAADAGFDPLFKELDAIYAHRIKRHVILVDDASGREDMVMRGAPPHYRASVRNNIIRIVPV
jgi:glycosyltransferase involved in cell wall biosynthesis